MLIHSYIYVDTMRPKAHRLEYGSTYSIPTMCWILSLFCWAALLCCAQASSSSSSASSVRSLVLGIDGGTESIRACCFDATSGRVVGKACAVPYVTSHPHAGWAEQNPHDWYENLCAAVRGAVASLPCHVEICAMAVDTTCCSVVALDDRNEPLRPCLLWMDQRSAGQAKEILEMCRGDPALAVNCGGNGPLSAEWMTPKALWIYQNERESVWNKAKTICEYQDFINYKLTGVICASSCNAASRWHWNGELCIQESSKDNKYPGRPLSLYKKLGIPDLAEKLPEKCLPMGAVVGGLTKDAAKALGLAVGLPIVQGGADAFVGMIGLGCIHPGQLCLITGSSHLHCAVTSKATTSSGVWGAYQGAPLPGINFAEGGQSSTGSIVRWARELFGASSLSYQELDEEAARIAPGAAGLVVLETFQGSRTPVTDPLARGAFLGLTLSHTRAHIWRAVLEAVCFGTKSCIDGLAEAGHPCDEITMAGGSTRSPFWLQLHADITGKPVVVCENSDAPLLGCAVLASVGVGIQASVKQAVASMVRTSKRIEPDVEQTRIYGDLYSGIYSKVADVVCPVAHAIQATRSSCVDTTTRLTGGGQIDLDTKHTDATSEQVVISPSLLACDWANIEKEVHRALDAGATLLHVDIFDGVFLNSPEALTFGPQMVGAIRRSCNSATVPGGFLDLHMCVERPLRFVETMAIAGGDRFIFQWEAMKNEAEAKKLIDKVLASGMEVGISLNSLTDFSEIHSLLRSGKVSVVDLLAVEPGFGGQSFQESVLEKINRLREWREREKLSFLIMVDGGVNDSTATFISARGADILVSGSFLFTHPEGMRKGIDMLLLRTLDRVRPSLSFTK